MHNGQKLTLAKADAIGTIWPSDREVCPGLHFCPDWDQMAICKGTPEWDCCTCSIKSEIEND